MDWKLDGQPGRTAHVDGREYLFFSGYSYLGIQQVPEFKQLVWEGMGTYGWLHPSSRISNTRLALYEECEGLLCQITGCERTMLVSSGYAAGNLAVSKWVGKITNLQPSHPAIKTTNAQTPQGVYAVDSVDVLTSSITDIGAVNNVSGLNTLIIDDSHGIGLIGENGRGAAGRLERKPGAEYIFTYSLSKAFGIQGGAISCSAALATEYCGQPAYTASTAPSPALLYAFLHGQQIYNNQCGLLRQNIQYFRELIGGLTGIDNNPSLPIFVLPEGMDEAAFADKQIIISSFAYPSPASKKMNRVVLNALHTKNDLEYLAECLTECYNVK